MVGKWVENDGFMIEHDDFLRNPVYDVYINWRDGFEPMVEVVEVVDFPHLAISITTMGTVRQTAIDHNLPRARPWATWQRGTWRWSQCSWDLSIRHSWQSLATPVALWTSGWRLGSGWDDRREIRDQCIILACSWIVTLSSLNHYGLSS